MKKKEESNGYIIIIIFLCVAIFIAFGIYIEYDKVSKGENSINVTSDMNIMRTQFVISYIYPNLTNEQKLEVHRSIWYYKTQK
jgi:hypothetical protein